MQAPILYGYDAERFFTRSFTAQKHPRTEAYITDVRMSTTLPLPGNPDALEPWSGYRLSEDGAAWAVKPDNRGRTGYTVDGGWVTVATPALPPEWHGEEPPEPGLSLEEARAAAIARIDAETSAAILAGFDHEMDGEVLHFSYDLNDQQNFADTANASTLARMGVPGLPQTVTWNGWRIARDEAGDEISRSLVRLALTPDSFLTLYMGGALAHKAARMETGGRRKTAAEAARTREELEAV